MGKKEINWKLIVAIAIIVLAVIIIWGLIGGNIVEDNIIRLKCDVGIGDSFCWIWHDAVKEMQQNIEESAASFRELFEN